MPVGKVLQGRKGFMGVEILRELPETVGLLHVQSNFVSDGFAVVAAAVLSDSEDGFRIETFFQIGTYADSPVEFLVCVCALG